MTHLVFFKKLWIRFFTNAPYKVSSFKSIHKKRLGSPVDVPETLTAIIKEEKGGFLYYPGEPNTFGNKLIHRSIKTKDRFKQSGVFAEPDRAIYSIENGVVFGQLGIIYDKKSRTYIDESTKEWITPLKFSRFTSIINFPAPKVLEGISLSCVTNGADAGFYHFFFESLPKLYYCLSFLNNIDHYILNGPATEWKIKWLRKANIDLNKVVWMNYNGHFSCKQLLFTSNLIHDQQVNKWCVNSLKRLFNIQESAPTTNNEAIIWISRTDTKSRVITWENLILSAFPMIEKVDFALLNEVGTLDKIKSAAYVIGPHGAGFSNILFCNPGTKILELFPLNSHYIPCYFRLSTICQLKHSVAYVDFDNDANNESGLQFLKVLLETFVTRHAE